MEYKTSTWTKLLHLVAWIILLSGVFFALIVPYFIPELLDFYLSEFNSDILFESISKGPKTMIQFLFGLIGGIMIGWGILLIIITRQLFIKDEPWIWRAITISAIGWFLFDSVLSIALGSFFNVIFNLVFLDLVMLPIVGYNYSNWKTSKNKNSVSM
ncbi:MAG: hypothetical protein HeimC3_15550 [Candidatus Heimdallarchaeota archaeon LC_3]|nr:MAG: hypothetical protein HeimC3_15550 [Candidatus Heimdallarchaeota archaeon LC_3]